MNIRLQTLMKERGLTIQLMSDMSGISFKLIAIAETRGITLDTLQRLASFLGVPTWEMVTPCAVPATINNVVEMSCQCGHSHVMRIDNLWTSVSAPDRNPCDIIRGLIKERKLTLAQFGDMIGMSQGNLSHFLNSSNPSLMVFDRIIEALGVEPWEIFTTREDMDAEAERRRMRKAVASITMTCPNCGNPMVSRMK